MTHDYVPTADRIGGTLSGLRDTCDPRQHIRLMSEQEVEMLLATINEWHWLWRPCQRRLKELEGARQRRTA